MERTANQKIYNVIILDATGSMNVIKDSTISGFNELGQTIKGIEKQFPDQKHFVTLVTFNSLGIKTPLFNEDVGNLRELTTRSYQPTASTPLYDAIGLTLSKMKYTVQDETDYNVLVTIITDGEENDSKEFSHRAIANMINELKELNWTFTFIGSSGIDAERIATGINIEVTNVLKFNQNPRDTRAMFKKEFDAHRRYVDKIRMHEPVANDYFTKEERENI